MIERLDYYHVRIPLSRMFRTSMGSTGTYNGFLVNIRTDDGLDGWGESIPPKRITGETDGSVRAALDMIREAVKGKDETSIELLWELMEKRVKGSYAAKCGVDVALWDIMGKRAGMPICRLAGGYRDSMHTSFTVDLGSMEEEEEQLNEYISMGIHALKIKLGHGIREDYERVKRARQKGGEDVAVYVDFNQSYTPKKALELSESIHKFEIEFLEQPVRAADLDGLKFVRERSSIPVMADESVHGPEDAVRIIGMGAADMLNMKLVKAGGISRGKRIIELAESAGLPVMIGCTVESRVGITAAAHLALGLKNVHYTDLDGYHSLSKELTKDGLRLTAGEHEVSGKPGLGLTVDLDRVKEQLAKVT